MKPEQPENMDLIRKIAWSLNKSSRLDYNDLFSQACLFYYESLLHYDSSKGKLTTYAYQYIHNNMINYVRKEFREQSHRGDVELFMSSYSHHPFWELWDGFSTNAQLLIRFILNNPSRLLDKPPKMIRGQLFRELRKAGWTHVAIRDTFREIKLALNES